MVSIEKKQYKHSYLAYLIVATASFFLAAFFLLGYFTVKNNYIDTQFKQYNTTIAIIKHNISNYLINQKELIQSLAQSTEIIDFFKNQNSHATLTQFLETKKNNQYSTIIIFDQNNKPIFASDNNIGKYAENKALTNSAQRSLILGSADITDVTEIPPNALPEAQWKMYITTPVIHEKNLLGFIALELNTQKIMAVVSNYQKIVDHENITIINTTNNEPTMLLPTGIAQLCSYKTPNSSCAIYKEAFLRAIRGESGTAIGSNKDQQKTMITWQYIPETQWAIMLESSYTEVLEPLWTLKIVLLSIILLLMMVMLYCLFKAYQQLNQTINWVLIPTKISRIFLYILFILNTIMLVLFIMQYHRARSIYLQKQNSQFQISLKQAAQQIDTAIANIETIANSMVLDITNQTPDQHTLQQWLQKTLQQNSNLFSISVALKKDALWNLLSMHQQKEPVIELHIKKDQIDWLQQALEKTRTWITPLTKAAPMYTVKFYLKNDIEQKEPFGVISITYNKQNILTIAQQYMNNNQFIVTDAEKAIVYPEQQTQPNTLHTNNNNLRYELIPHLGWYIASKPDTTRSARGNEFYMLLLGITIMLANLCIVSYSFIRYETSDKNKNNRLMLYACLLVMLLTCIKLWVTL